MRTGRSMLEVVGRTPVVRLSSVVPAEAADVFVKLEWFNPTGSYKDRMALAMIEEAERRGELVSGMTVIECPGGCTRCDPSTRPQGGRWPDYSPPDRGCSPARPAA